MRSFDFFVIGVVFLLSLCAACGDAGESTHSGDTPNSDGAASSSETRVLRGATELLRAPGRDERLEGRLASQMFWKRLRESALEVEQAVGIAGLDPRHPEMADEFAKLFAAATTKHPQLPEAWLSEHVELKVVELPGAARPRARATRFSSPAWDARNPFMTHPASPSLDIEGGVMRSSDRLPRERSTADAQRTPMVAYVDHVPTFTEMEELAKAGVSAVIAMSRPDPDAKAMAGDLHLKDVPDRNGRMLPIALIEVNELGSQKLRDSIDDPESTVAIRIVGADVEARGRVVSVRIRGNVAPDEKIIVTMGREHLPLSPELGSESIMTATLIELARAVAVTFGDPRAKSTLGCTCEIACVLDDGSGYEFIEALARPDELLLGVVNLSSLPTATPESKRIAVAVGAADSPGLVPKAAWSAAADYRNQPQTWKVVAFDVAQDGPSAEAARRMGQVAIPFVEISGARAATRRSIEPDPRAPAQDDATRFVDAVHADVSSVDNVLTKIADERLSRACAMGALAALTIARCSQAYTAP